MKRRFTQLALSAALPETADSPLSVGRVLILENAINLARIDPLDCWGIRIIGTAGHQNFSQIIARKNVIAPVYGSAATISLFGLTLKNINNTIVENNVLDHCDGVPLSYNDCVTMKAFNNKRPDGTLLRAYNISTTLFLQELQDAVDDAIIGI